MLKRLFLPILLSLLFMGISEAQRWKLKRYEVGVGVGTANLFGDIGGGATRENLMGLKDLRITFTRPALSFGARYRFSNSFSSKLNFFYGYGYASDAGSVNEYRGATVNRQMMETSLQFEFALISEDTRISSTAMFYRRGMASNYTRYGIYLFAGGGTTFSLVKPVIPPNIPELRYDWEALAIKGFSIDPILLGGIGAKLMLDPDWTIGGEFGGRLGLTDNIDGYNHQNGIYKNEANDIYYFTSISIIYRIKNDRYGIPMFIKPLLGRKASSGTAKPLN